MQDLILEPGSFRDRNGRVFYKGQSVFRSLSTQALLEWEYLSSTVFFRKWLDHEKIIGTKLITEKMVTLPGSEWFEKGTFLKHELIPFISYPYEWCFSMLKEAALMQLDLLRDALEEGMILKDSSPFNFQWIGAMPVFIDILSFERLRENEPWVGYRQFCQLFLFPLFLQAYKEIPFHSILRGDIDGIDPDIMNNIMSFSDLFRPGVFKNVFIHSKFQNKYSDTNRNIKNELGKVGFNKELIKNNINKLYIIVSKLEWKLTKSQWSDYTQTHSYDEEIEKKKSFVESVISSADKWKLVWDIGCNTGSFSRIAAQNSEYTIAMDADHLAIERLYRELAEEKNQAILPMVININNPSPDHGWRGIERKNIVTRGKPDLVLCLALIHHIVITSNIPLNEFIDWLASLEASIIIEFITKDDPLVKKLLRNKNDQYRDYEINYFEKCLTDFFKIIQSTEVKSGMRKLYYTKPKRAF